PVVKSFTPSLTTPFYYVVQSGDDLFLIGKRFEIDPTAIVDANHLQNNLIVLGSTILIPAGPHIHVVLAGETLSSIAARYNVAVSVLTTSNPGVSSPNAIFAGQNIFIPIIYGALPMPVTAGGTAVPTPTSTTKPGASATPGPTATTAAGNFIQVTVHRGESFITYVSRYGVNRRRLRAANPKLADPN